MADEDIGRAEAFLRQTTLSPPETFELAMRLKARHEFGYARQLLERLLSSQADFSLSADVRRQLAFCVARDWNLSLDLRFNQALDILTRGGDLASAGQATLGIAGSIYRAKWNAFAQLQDLKTALGYYLEAYSQGIEGDLGQSASYSSYLLNVLADQEARDAETVGIALEDSRRHDERAHQIRQEILDKLSILAKKPGNEGLSSNWSFLVTMAGAYLGLKDYDRAGRYLTQARALPDVSDEEYQSVARDLSKLVMVLSQPVDPGARKVLEEFLQGYDYAASTIFLGKVGLALSGGGFRASLYHIGLLAKLAELDMLRHVEVLSCVSGGSIVGAYYYLELKRLLESKADAEITREDYIEIVKRMEMEFLAGVQRNIRMRLLTNLIENYRMALNSCRSRTHRAGELYEKVLYSRITGNDDEIWLNDLKIFPKDERKEFKPYYHNWRRAAKVPILVLNATTLNTGHNWQFTAAWMGEPPEGIDGRVDGNSRLRRTRYSEAPPEYQKVRLGHAVAASACVPGLLDPLVMPNLYPDFAVSLVDGGVYDNQGSAALLDQGCTVLLASDASGQMEDTKRPSPDLLGVTMRTSSILQARLRVAQYHDLEDRRRAGVLKGFMFVHLKEDLEVHDVNWIGCPYPAKPRNSSAVTTYGIRKDVQRHLAAVRTDLDSFNDAEAFALMTSGYRMAQSALPAAVEGFPLNSGLAEWRFLKIEDCLTPGKSAPSEKKFQEISKLLSIASIDAFKIWYLIPVLKWTGLLLIAMAFVAVVGSCLWWSSTPLLTAGMVGWTILSLAATALFGKHLVKLVQVRTTYRRVLLGLILGSLAWLVTWIHLLIFDRLYLGHGRLDRFIGRTLRS